MATDTRNKRYVKNLIFSIVSKVLIFGIGLIIPRLLILSYGSEYNGLLGSITNIYTYIALIEAGIGTVATQALYKPIVNGDKEGISSILVATRNYFRRLIKWYLLAVIIMSTVFPLIVKTEIPYFIILALVFIQGLSHILTYYFASAVMQILSADGK